MIARAPATILHHEVMTLRTKTVLKMAEQKARRSWPLVAMLPRKPDLKSLPLDFLYMRDI